MPPLRADDDLELDKLFSAISNDMASAAIHWRLLQRLDGLRNEFLHELNQANCFWRLTFEAHRDAALWRLGRLYDKTPGALSLPNFLSTLLTKQSSFEEPAFRARLADSPFVATLAKDRQLSVAQVQADIAQVTRDDPLVDALVTYRNKYLGHRDANVVLGRLAIQGLSGGDVTTLLDRAREIINHYSLLYRASVQSVNIIGGDDCESVLRAVRRSIKANEDAIEREVAEAARAEGNGLGSESGA